MGTEEGAKVIELMYDLIDTIPYLVFAGVFGGIELAGIFTFLTWKTKNIIFLYWAIALINLFVVLPVAIWCAMCAPTVMLSAAGYYPEAEQVLVLMAEWLIEMCMVIVIFTFGMLAVMSFASIQYIKGMFENKNEMWEFRNLTQYREKSNEEK